MHTENQNRFFFHKCSIKKSLAVLNTRSIIFVAILNACTYIYTFLLFWKLKQKSFYYGTTRLYGHGCKIAVSGGCKLKLFFNQVDWWDTRFLVKFNFPPELFRVCVIGKSGVAIICLVAELWATTEIDCNMLSLCSIQHATLPLETFRVSFCW